MARLISVALTEQAVRERRKSVTRRLGWWTDKRGRRLLKPGDRLTLVRKSQGRHRPDGTVEPLVRLAEVEVVDVRREPLADMWLQAGETAREGFPEWSATRFIKFFCEQMRCDPETEVTRIEFRYLDGEVVIPGGR